ncbi:MAG: hypothetical protein ACRCYY_08885 [Trueperaceae bacterium]
MTLYSLLLAIHITAGTLGLIAAFLATFNKAFNLTHRWHVYTGSAFVIAMAIIFVTATAMSLIKLNIFLLLVGIFSFYLAFSGWRYARNRKGTPTGLDWTTAITMLVISAVMVSFALYLFLTGSGGSIVIAVFGLIGGQLAFFDYRSLRRGGLKGKERIVRHLTMMLGGSIAALTAFTVVNINMQPAFIPWLAPTVLITPVIALWSRKIRTGATTKEM